MKKSEKVEAVEKLTNDLSHAKSVTVINYQGLATKDLEGLRTELSKVGGKFSVVKNTLLKLALERTQNIVHSAQEAPIQGLIGPTAVVVATGDEIAPLQVVAKMIKDRGLPKLKFGVFENDVLDTATLDALSKLPGKTNLYGRLVGTISGPMYGLVETLNSNLQSLVWTLDQRGKQTV